MNNIPPLAAPADIARNNNTPDPRMRTDAQLSSMDNEAIIQHVAGLLFGDRDINILDPDTNLSAYLKNALSYCEDINEPRTVGGEDTLLSKAIKREQCDLIELLIKNFDADVNAEYITCTSYRECCSSSALAYAVETGNSAIVKMLLDAKADLEIGDEENNSRTKTPLTLAAEAAHPGLVKMLIAAGASVNTPDHEFKPMQMAAKSGCMESIELLLNAGSNIHSLDDRILKRSVLFYAVEIDSRYPEKCPIATVSYFLAANCDVEHRDFWGATPILYASENSTPAVVSTLVAGNANPHVSDDKGNTALHYAVKNKRFAGEICDLLIKYNLDVEKPTNNGKTPIFAAAQKNSCDAVRVLFNANANVNCHYVLKYQTLSYTPLLIAAADGVPSLVDVLVREFIN